MIRAVIFDFWQVLADKSHRIFDEVKDVLDVDETAHPYFMELFEQLNAGQINEQDFWALFCTEFNVPVPSHLTPWREYYESIVIFNDDVLAITADLKRRGYRVVLLSNSDPGSSAFLKMAKQLDHFDARYLSSEISLVKPHREIYEYVLNILDIEPDEAIFVDDKLENVEGAQMVGMHGILFRNAAQLALDLEKLS